MRARHILLLLVAASLLAVDALPGRNKTKRKDVIASKNDAEDDGPDDEGISEIFAGVDEGEKGSGEKGSGVDNTDGHEDIFEINAKDNMADMLDEGDMILNNKQRYEQITGKDAEGHDADPELDATYRWDNRTIPYVISKDIKDKDPKYKALVDKAIKEFNAKTCVTWKERDGEPNYVEFGTGWGCNSYVGKRSTGGQSLTLQFPECFAHEIVLHEMMHAAGYYHEHTRTDRDDHVKIRWENIHEFFKYDFIKKQKAGNVISSKELTPYDLGSIMHYREKDASYNDKKTIEVKDKKFKGKIGMAKELSPLDICGLAKLYECESDCKRSITKKQKHTKTAAS